MSPKKPAKKPKSTAVARKAKGFTAEEKAAMKERVRELKGESEGEGAVSPRSPACNRPIAPWASGSTPLSWPTRRR